MIKLETKQKSSNEVEVSITDEAGCGQRFSFTWLDGHLVINAAYQHKNKLNPARPAVYQAGEYMAITTI